MTKIMCAKILGKHENQTFAHFAAFCKKGSEPLVSAAQSAGRPWRRISPLSATEPLFGRSARGSGQVCPCLLLKQ